MQTEYIPEALDGIFLDPIAEKLESKAISKAEQAVQNEKPLIDTLINYNEDEQ